MLSDVIMNFFFSYIFIDIVLMFYILVSIIYIIYLYVLKIIEKR